LSVVTVPDMRKIVSDHLRSHAEVTPFTNRVVAKPADNTATPWVRVRQINATDRHESDYFGDCMFQCDCYAGATGGWPEANDLARAVRKALKLMPAATHTGAVVTRVNIVGDTELEDPDVDDPARARRIVTATIYAHA
jgi:hypothetical protein